VNRIKMLSGKRPYDRVSRQGVISVIADALVSAGTAQMKSAVVRAGRHSSQGDAGPRCSSQLGPPRPSPDTRVNWGVLVY
jgi:hypothetical protein